MSLNVSEQTATQITEAAQREGLSVDALLQRMMKERCGSEADKGSSSLGLPVLRLGPMGPLHRRDIYNDVR
jgi:aspartate aminotransferase-like enzyme